MPLSTERMLVVVHRTIGRNMPIGAVSRNNFEYLQCTLQTIAK